MAAVSQEGMLVVFTSPLENVPYTLAEVAVAGIPLVTFDVGGATELIDSKIHDDLFCGLPTVRLPLTAIITFQFPQVQGHKNRIFTYLL